MFARNLGRIGSSMVNKVAPGCAFKSCISANYSIQASVLRQKFPNNSMNVITTRGFKSIYKNKKTYCLKTKKAVLKRFRLTGQGTLKSNHSGKSHLARNKGRSRISRLAQTKTIRGVYLKRLKTLIVHGK